MFVSSLLFGDILCIKNGGGGGQPQLISNQVWFSLKLLLYVITCEGSKNDD